MTYPAGTHVVCENPYCTIEGRLVGDVEDFEGEFLVRTDDGELLRVYGWLCDTEVTEEPAVTEPTHIISVGPSTTFPGLWWGSVHLAGKPVGPVQTGHYSSEEAARDACARYVRTVTCN